MVDLKSGKTAHLFPTAPKITGLSASLDEQLLLATTPTVRNTTIVYDIRRWTPIIEYYKAVQRGRFCFNSRPQLLTSVHTIWREMHSTTVMVQLWDASSGEVDLEYQVEARRPRISALAATENIVALSTRDESRAHLHFFPTQ